MKTAPSSNVFHTSARLCPKGGKAQIIGPEEEDEENDGYPFNEVRRLKVLFLFCTILPFPPSAQYLLWFVLGQTDGPFQDIELLKLRPAHMTVFMRYIFTQLLDPNPLVRFHLVL